MCIVMKTKLIAVMSILSLFGCKEKTASYPQDVVQTRSGQELTITFFKHASLSLEFEGHYIYVDPVSTYADYAKLPKADVILITHSHYDHFDMEAIDRLMKDGTVVVCDKTSAEAFEFDCVTMTPGSVSAPVDGVDITAVPAIQYHGRAPAVPPARTRRLRIYPYHGRYAHIHIGRYRE